MRPPDDGMVTLRYACNSAGRAVRLYLAPHRFLQVPLPRVRKRNIPADPNCPPRTGRPSVLCPESPLLPVNMSPSSAPPSPSPGAPALVNVPVAAPGRPPCVSRSPRMARGVRAGYVALFALGAALAAGVFTTAGAATGADPAAPGLPA